MQVIQYSKFSAGGLIHRDYREEGEVAVRSNSVIQPAIINIDGVRLFSDTPTTAKQAADINEQVKQWAEAAK